MRYSGREKRAGMKVPPEHFAVVNELRNGRMVTGREYATLYSGSGTPPRRLRRSLSAGEGTTRWSASSDRGSLSRSYGPPTWSIGWSSPCSAQSRGTLRGQTRPRSGHPARPGRPGQVGPAHEHGGLVEEMLEAAGRNDLQDPAGRVPCVPERVPLLARLEDRPARSRRQSPRSRPWTAHRPTQGRPPCRRAARSDAALRAVEATPRDCRRALFGLHSNSLFR